MGNRDTPRRVLRPVGDLLFGEATMASREVHAEPVGECFGPYIVREIKRQYPASARSDPRFQDILRRTARIETNCSYSEHPRLPLRRAL